ncbi:UNVERIFIED_CONTAM: hypothetical protein K2H54_044049 [Gekko kuhli]
MIAEYYCTTVPTLKLALFQIYPPQIILLMGKSINSLPHADCINSHKYIGLDPASFFLNLIQFHLSVVHMGPMIPSTSLFGDQRRRNLPFSCAEKQKAFSLPKIEPSLPPPPFSPGQPNFHTVTT